MSIRKMVVAAIAAFVLVLFASAVSAQDGGSNPSTVVATPTVVVDGGATPTIDGAIAAVIIDGGAALDAGQAVITPTADDSVGWAVSLYNAIRAGKWLPAIGAIVMIVVFALRRFGKWIPGTTSKIGGNLLSFAVSCLAVLGPALAVGSFSWGLLWQAVAVGLSASGLWEITKDLTRKSPTA